MKWNLKILVSIFLLTLGASQTLADIYEWAWVNPNDPTQGVYQSSVVCPGGSGVYAVPDANLSDLDLTQAYLIGANLTFTHLYQATLTNANLTGAAVVGADFGNSNLTAPQLYSTASYQAHNLYGIGLGGNNMTGWNFSGQNLTGAYLAGATLTNANLTNANLAYAYLSQAMLTNANLASATLTNAYLTEADLRGAQGFSGSAAVTTNTVLPDGTIQGINLDGNNPTLLVCNYSGSSSIPIHILQGMSMYPWSSLVFQFDGNPWGSTISFDAGIPITLGGNIELGLAPGTNPATLVAQNVQLFDWTGVSPGQFAQIVSDLPTRFLWNTSALYTLGQVGLTLSATPINGQWANNGSANWSGMANWSGGNVPGAPQDTALFGTALTSGTATVTLDSFVSLASLSFSTTGGASYVINPSSYASTLILSNTAGPATVSNSGGNNTIAVPITLESDLSVSASTGSVLTISSAISESGGSRSLTLSGDGQLILSGSNTYTGGTDVVGGTLVVTSNAALADGTSLTVGTGASAIFGGAAVPQTAAAVPEPGTLMLLGAGAIVLLGYTWCHRRS